MLVSKYEPPYDSQVIIMVGLYCVHAQPGLVILIFRCYGCVYVWVVITFGRLYINRVWLVVNNHAHMVS